MKKSTNKGITLIALVITIIVLLILAGVSIATLTGQNGVLTKAENAKTATKEETAKEEVKLAWAAITSDYYEGKKGSKKSNYYTQENLNQELKETGKITEFNYQEEGTTTLVYVKKDGEYNMQITTKGEIIIHENEKTGTITNLKKGDYIKLIDKKGIERTCVVLYDANSSNGIQVVTLDDVDKVALGNETSFEKAKDSWDNAVTILNNKAKEYVNESWGSNARCVGSMQNSSETTELTATKSINRLVTVNYDNNYEKDYEILQELGISDCISSYWLGSKFVVEDLEGDARYWYGMYFVVSDGSLPFEGDATFCSEYYNSNLRSPTFSICEKGLRVVFSH